MVLLLYIVLFLVLGHDVFVVVFTVWLLHSVVDHDLFFCRVIMVSLSFPFDLPVCSRQICISDTSSIFHGM